MDLAWASSRMEGNTYEILQTERLLEAGEQADGKDRAEALMILNHKDAIQYVVSLLAEAAIDRRTLFDTRAERCRVAQGGVPGELSRVRSALRAQMDSRARLRSPIVTA